MNLTDKVLINNLCDWPLHTRRLNGVGDITIPARVKNFAQLDVAEVQMHIQLNDPLFVGTDADHPGDHARLYIVDDEIRKQLFGYEADGEEDVIHLTAEAVKKLLAVRKRDDFKKQLEALVKTDAEKKMIVRIAKENGGDEVASWKMEAINNLATKVFI